MVRSARTPCCPSPHAPQPWDSLQLLTHTTAWPGSLGVSHTSMGSFRKEGRRGNAGTGITPLSYLSGQPFPFPGIPYQITSLSFAILFLWVSPSRKLLFKNFVFSFAGTCCTLGPLGGFPTTPPPSPGRLFIAQGLHLGWVSQVSPTPAIHI